MSAPVTGPLTDRQIEILNLVAKGWKYAQIARFLCLSKAAVSRNVSGAVAKLGAANIAQAMYLWGRHGAQR